MNVNEALFIGHEQAKDDNAPESYNELKAKVKALIDKHGAEDFLLSVVVGLDETYKEASDKVNQARLELGYK